MCPSCPQQVVAWLLPLQELWRGEPLRSQAHPALPTLWRPDGRSQNWCPALLQLASPRSKRWTSRPLWMQEAGLWVRAHLTEHRTPISWGHRPCWLTKPSRNRPCQPAELQGRKEQEGKHLPITCMHLQRSLLLQLKFRTCFKLETQGGKKPLSKLIHLVLNLPQLGLINKHNSSLKPKNY